MTRRIAIGAAATAVVLGVGACNAQNETRGIGDSPVGRHDDTPAEVVNFPDQFANVTTKCNHGNRIYSTTRQAAVVVIPADPSCAVG